MFNLNINKITTDSQGELLVLENKRKKTYRMMETIRTNRNFCMSLTGSVQKLV